MSLKKYQVNYTAYVDHCGECEFDQDGECELTGTKIEEHWQGVLEDCPLEDDDELESD